MKTVPAGLQTHLDAGVTTLATLWKVTRRDGTVLGFTDHDADLVVGGVTYTAATGYTRTAIQSSADFAVDNLDLEGILASGAVTEADIRAGLYYGAQVIISVCNYADLASGTVELRRGWLGQIRVRQGTYVAELRGLTDRLQQTIGRVYGRECDADLGDTRCGVRLDPPTWQASTAYTQRQTADAATGSVVQPTSANGAYFKCSVAGTSGGTEPTWNTTPGATTTDGSVTWVALQALKRAGLVDSVVDNHTLNDPTLTQQIWAGGKVTWLTGDNAGAAQEIKAADASGNITLWEEPASAMQAGDTFTIQAGCQKRRTNDCVTLFDNAKNFRGFDTIPGTDYLTGTYPDAP